MRLIILCLLTSMLLIGCNSDLKVNDGIVESKMDSFSLDKDQYEIDINALTDFPWDKAYIFTPYTPKEHVTKKLGFNWRNSIGIDYRDDINLIVFVKGKRVVKYIELSRKYGDFDVQDIENEIMPDHAIKTLKILD